jgi:hypothetical protein
VGDILLVQVQVVRGCVVGFEDCEVLAPQVVTLFVNVAKPSSGASVVMGCSVSNPKGGMFTPKWCHRQAADATRNPRGMPRMPCMQNVHK